MSKALPYTFRNPDLLRLALTVPAANRHEADNQRLEFLGDAVLQLLTSEQLYARYPSLDEGGLTDLRAQLVSGVALRKRASRLDLAERLKEANPNKDWPQKALTDAVESLIGAAWLDGGREAVLPFFNILFPESELEGLSPRKNIGENPKKALLTYVQAHSLGEPIFVIHKTGPEHAPTFACTLTLGATTANGQGSTRKSAEQAAAETLLSLLKAPTP